MDRGSGRRVEPRSPERGATRAQYLLFFVLVAIAVVVTVALLWGRLGADDAGFAFTVMS
jgi:hypothetical protein